MNPKPSQKSATSEPSRPLHRSITERYVITGTLVLVTPASFGNGDAAGWTDVPLLLDECTGEPLLTGASLAGALRNYLGECEAGYEVSARHKRQHSKYEQVLFGCFSGDDEGDQSALIVHDAYGSDYAFEVRDGVKIEGATRTAEDQKKYDLELLAAGTKFDLRFDLAVSDKLGNKADLLAALATALSGLERRDGGESGDITLGARKRRGYGRCYVASWQVAHYRLGQRAELLAWLTNGRSATYQDRAKAVQPQTFVSIHQALNAKPIKDLREQITLTVTFELAGSMLVRAAYDESEATGSKAAKGKRAPDFVHLQTRRVTDTGKANFVPIIAGTTWAGAWRSRASLIAKTLAKDEKTARQMIASLFGPEEIKEGDASYSSRLVFADSPVIKAHPLMQTRVKIDRFTGGAFESALFTEKPLWGTPETRLTLNLALRLPQQNDEQALSPQAAVGLLMLTLKDFWTGDAALGGEIGIGRGRLGGVSAHLQWQSEEWRFESDDTKSLRAEGVAERLEKCVEKLHQELQA